MADIRRARPRSPHLQVYHWGLHMLVSIVHRATGAALGFGTLLLAWWLMAVAAGPDQYDIFRTAAMHPLGRFVLFGFSFALIYHLLNGIRHLYWNTGRGITVESIALSGKMVVVFSIVLTLGAWVAAYWVAGRIG